MKTFILSFALIISAQALAGGSMGGTPPAKEQEMLEQLADRGTGLLKNPDILLSNDELKLIPLDTATIRRLELRVASRGQAPLTLPNGETFQLRKDLADRLIDIRKAAWVVDQADFPTEAMPSEP